MPLIGKQYEIETTVTVRQKVMVTADTCAEHNLGLPKSSLPLLEYTDEEVTNTAFGLARNRVYDVLEKAGIKVTETGVEEMV